MERRFVVPAVTFIAGVILWVGHLLFYLLGGGAQALTRTLSLYTSLAVGGLLFFSGLRCHQSGGPWVGGVARSVVLLIMAVVTFWKIGAGAAWVLLAAAAATGVFGLLGFRRRKTAGD